MLENRETTQDIKQISEEEYKSYESLYKYEAIDENVENTFLDSIDQQVSDENKKQCDTEMTLNDLTDALKTMTKEDHRK